MLPRRSSLRFLLSFLLATVPLLSHHGRAQTRRPRTVPEEVTVLNLLFAGWQISSSKSDIGWNTTDGDPCTGAAVDHSDLAEKNFNPGIKCNCTFKNNSNNSICHITDLKVDRLDVKGVIPEYLTNLTFLETLHLRGNALSGIIPAMVGNLHKLVSLDLGMNSFSGSLPEDLGNLTNLRILRLDSLGYISGGIPSKFADLKDLRIMWASDNKFTGRIPEFIGSLTELTDLRFQGNSFQGPIPQTFSNLTNLIQLRIGELTNGSSKLDLLKNMKSLRTLILRNAQVSDTLPISFPDLVFMDLSFNNLSGQLPDTLFNLASLQYLFLGNNNLSGVLPREKSPRLQSIDLSYNELSGSLPSWVYDANLTLNLVANNFIIPNSRVLHGLNCLQRNFSCSFGSFSRTSLGVNCGGDISVNADGIQYEIDNKNLLNASYYVSEDGWAVSNVGNFSDAELSPSYILKTESRFSGTDNSELFQWVRQSPSSLRYYFFGLERGNYNVKLQFGEKDDWSLNARRLFDIYIQDKLVVQDFDITESAGGYELKAVRWEGNASVVNNVLMIHFFWAGKGTCCMPTDGKYGISVAAISVSQSQKSPPLEPVQAIYERKTKILFPALAILSIALLLLIISGLFIWKWNLRKPGMDDDEELRELTDKPDIFSYAELRAATEDFSDTKKIGQGGSGVVFKGVLPDGKEVAIKKLSAVSATARRQFITEIATVSTVQHRNLVKLHGCCYERGNFLLVYEYLTNKSLDQVLFGNSKLQLDWPTRFGICLGTARGLAYLHEESSARIVHRDVKASNILLDSDFVPKVSDFGLAKLRNDDKSHISAGVAGTIGYLAPEYAMRGQLTEKVDVFGFGVVALEILCGRKNYDSSLGAEKMYLLEWAWHLHEGKRDLEMVDPTLSSYNEEEAIRVIGVALLCTQSSPMRRPSMSRVIAMLAGNKEIGEISGKPNYLMDWQFSDTSRDALSSTYSASATFENPPQHTSSP